MTACNSAGAPRTPSPPVPTARRRSSRIALRLAGAASLLLLSLGACIVEEHDYDEHLARCDEYCRLVEDKCQGDYKVYDYREQCLAVCQQMDLGAPALGKSDGQNNVACRIERLKQTEFDAKPAENCPGVGPGGAGVCGDDCDSFCALRERVCTGVANQTYEYDLEPEKCATNCRAVPKLGTLSAARDQKGDSLECRLVHVSEAAVSPQKAATHCLHTQTVPKAAPTFPCSDDAELTKEDNCSKYCQQVLQACTGTDAVYKDEAECLAVCGVLEPGAPGDQSQNTVRCRRYHAYNALDEEGPDVHCTHAGPTGDGHCGADNCESYCTILRNACPTQFATQFPGAAAAGELSCRTKCNPPAGTPGALSGASANSFQTFDKGTRYSVNSPTLGDNLLCRTYHAVTALTELDKAKGANPNAQEDAVECGAAFGLAAPCMP